MAPSAARAMFVSADVVSVASSAASKNRDSSSSATRSMMFSRFTEVRGAGLVAFFWAGFLAGVFFAMRQFYAWEMGRPDGLLLDIDVLEVVRKL